MLTVMSSFHVKYKKQCTWLLWCLCQESVSQSIHGSFYIRWLSQPSAGICKCPPYKDNRTDENTQGNSRNKDLIFQRNLNASMSYRPLSARELPLVSHTMSVVTSQSPKMNISRNLRERHGREGFLCQLFSHCSISQLFCLSRHMHLHDSMS